MTCLLHVLIGSLALAPTTLPGGFGQGNYRIRLAYFVPSDRTPAKNYEQKIRTIMTIVADVYKNDLRAKGYETDGPAFVDGVQLVRGDKPASHYNNAPAYDADEQWKRLNPEIRSKIGNPQKQVIVVFAETYDSGPSEHLWPGVIARGGYNNAEGGLAVFASHLLQEGFSALTVEDQVRLMFDQTPVPGRKAWSNPMNSPRGAFIEDGIGAVAHELGHALGLPHDRRQDTIDMMGNGFRNLRWNFQEKATQKAKFSDECARLLMSSRYVATDLKLSDNQPPAVQATVSGGTLTVRATDNVGLRAFVVVDRTAGSVLAGRKLSGKSAEFRQTVPAGKKMQIIVTDDGGNLTRRAAG